MVTKKRGLSKRQLTDPRATSNDFIMTKSGFLFVNTRDFVRKNKSLC